MNDSDAMRGPCDTAAALVHELYIEEPKRALMPPVHPMVNGEQTQALIRLARGSNRESGWWQATVPGSPASCGGWTRRGA